VLALQLIYVYGPHNINIIRVTTKHTSLNFEIKIMDTWPVADASDTDIPKFAYRNIFRYFNLV